jgi:hypothetical protein
MLDIQSECDANSADWRQGLPRYEEKEISPSMSMIQYRIIESAPLPIKEKAERKTRQKYDFAAIPLGGAGAFPVGDADAKKLKTSIYQAAAIFRKANPDFQFKVSIEEDGKEIWVRRIDAPKVNTDVVTNGDYDYSSVAAE